ncbi:hypothetical protein M0805_009419 [Coniferiporia weirii]|nr:hypothetical protein M0805_009419 [Coniferiporia weirii]
MNASSAYASESILGPPSDPIHIREFIDRCSRSHAFRGPELPEEQKQEIEEECSVSDLEHTLNETISNPFHYVHLVHSLENNIEAIRSTSKANGQPRPKSRKRKKVETTALNEIEPPDECMQLRNDLDGIVLKCWPYPADAVAFIRPQRNSDLNILTNARKSQNPAPSSRPSPNQEAVIIVSVYNRLSWGNYLSCSSQHAVLSSQTIGDLYDVIPCPSNEIPSEKIVNGETVGYENQTPSHRGCVMCIEDIAYGDGQSEEDYSDKLIQQLELIPGKKRLQISKGVCMYDQQFAELTLRLNQPYWLLHQGTCEHFLVIDHIRLLHPTDPQEGYPLTLHITPPILDLCMACTRVPAVLSIVGDVRLGQSPYKACMPCWTHFGEPRPGDGVVVVPLPKYEHGW